MTCYACGKPAVDMHHFISRVSLYKHEYQDDRYRIPLCRECHTAVHFDPNNSGLRFYELHGIVKKLSVRCGYDPRWIKWMYGQIFKQQPMEKK